MSVRPPPLPPRPPLPPQPRLPSTIPPPPLPPFLAAQDAETLPGLFDARDVMRVNRENRELKRQLVLAFERQIAPLAPATNWEIAMSFAVATVKYALVAAAAVLLAHAMGL